MYHSQLCPMGFNLVNVPTRSSGDTTAPGKREEAVNSLITLLPATLLDALNPQKQQCMVRTEMSL